MLTCGEANIGCKSGIHFDQADSVHCVNHNMNVEWLSMFAEKSIICQMTPYENSAPNLSHAEATFGQKLTRE